MEDSYIEFLELRPNRSLCALLGPEGVDRLIADAGEIIERGKIDDCGTPGGKRGPRRKATP
jgi:hypothetical protein